MRLIEPIGFLTGSEAHEAVRSGTALPLGHLAYTMARLIEPGTDCLVRAGDLPAAWHDLATRLATPPAAWAGLPSPAIMGILNVTPDSFSDGGDRFDAATAIAAGRAMLAAGATLLDIGGESTRPGAAPLSPDAEQARILPVIEKLAAEGAIISVDTRNAATMAAALSAGARVINDVSALAFDAAAASVVAERQAPVVLMHMRGTPDRMGDHAVYDDVAVEVVQELAARMKAACAAGIARTRIAVDPGIGFAKIGAQNHELLRRLPLLCNLGCPILVGVSRKSFIGTLTGTRAAKNRGPGSLAAAVFALSRGAAVLRVHDVAETVQAVRVWQALAGGDPKPTAGCEPVLHTPL